VIGPYSSVKRGVSVAVLNVDVPSVKTAQLVALIATGTERPSESHHPQKICEKFKASLNG